jgi:lysophospholipase L1-like esterase
MAIRPVRRRLAAFGLAMALPITGATLAVAGPAAADHGTNNTARRTVFVAGDSTAATWPANTIPKAGWGQALPVFLNRAKVTVANEALSGASSKSFIEVGLLDKILASIKPGDYLLISFGHNDEKTDDRHTDPYTTFQEYLSRYIDGARQHRAHPVLVTPVERRRFDADGRAYASHGEYPQAMRDLGVARGVPVVDLTTLSMRLWDRLGVEETKRYFLWSAVGENPNFPDGVEDNTHFQAHGAIALARIVIRALVDQRVLPHHLAVRLTRPVPDNALAWPAVVAP